MKLVFLGTSEFAVPSLRAVVDKKHTVLRVVTQPDRPRGRGQKAGPPPTKIAAVELGLPVLQTEDVNISTIAAEIRGLEPQAIVVVSFGQKLGEELLKLAPLGCLNVHASVLPRYRGASPIHHAILEGQKRTGVSIIRLVEKMDAGDILGTDDTEIGPDETTGELSVRLADLGSKLLVSTLDALKKGTATAVRQDEKIATYAKKLTKADGEIDWRWPASRIKDLVRGFSPWPGAQTSVRSVDGRTQLRVTILRSEAEMNGGLTAEPGRVVEVTKNALRVATGKGYLRVLGIQPSGKRSMTASEFIRGYRPGVGDWFGKGGE
ncbi:MAG: methionyl-tRNA formyltransferase [Planctomycetes bacterium]|nr:methionyl-tRNA formyltransferase [Planctomycetota bacterium]MBI3846302.1 methionyl-tRNA formyltransferase [Planctomycetota bacterium]